MNLHEYQAKRLFADYGLPVSVGYGIDLGALKCRLGTKKARLWGFPFCIDVSLFFEHCGSVL